MIDDTDSDFDTGQERGVYYTDQRLRRVATYKGPVDRLDDAHAEAMLCELLLAYESELPLPPAGLPGVASGWTPDPAVMKLLQIGFDYFVAVAERRPRRQVKLFGEMEEVLGRARAYDRRRREDAEYDRDLAARAGPFVFHPGMGPHRQQRELVYFIASESGPIKIGMALDPEKRLKGLQTSHHEKLMILATCSGGRDQEWTYHKQFAEHRINGEWFARVPEILSEIERLAA
jgi:hypothetical protein